MEFTALRMTVDIEGFPCRQLYKQNGALFWDLDYLHPALVHHGADKHKFHWLSRVKEACSDVLFPFLVGMTRVHTARRDTPSDRLAANTCTPRHWLHICGTLSSVPDSSLLRTAVVTI